MSETEFVMMLLFVVVILIVGFWLYMSAHPEAARKEVKPATALVYNDQWSGENLCELPGTVLLDPGRHRVIETVSLRNEAQNPSNVKLFTADGVEIEVDYILRRLQVGYPDMPERWQDVDKDRLCRCAINAVTKIEYAKREDKIKTRVVACLQAALEKRTLNELFSDVKKDEAGAVTQVTVNTEAKEHLETEVNRSIREDIVTGVNEDGTEEEGWGFWVVMDLEDYNLPVVIRAARERKSAARMAGEALKDELTAAGVTDPQKRAELVGNIKTAEAFATALGAVFGGRGRSDHHDKGGDHR